MALLDQFGREIEVQKRPETREIAITTVRDRWSTYPSENLTPQKLAAIFKEADNGYVYRQAELFEEMEEKDTHLFSELQTRKNAVLGLDYDIVPYSESAEDKKIKDFVADCIFNLESFEDALLDLLDAVGKGYSLLEIMWDIQGNSARIGNLEWIHAKKAVFYELTSNMWAKSPEVPKIVTESEPVQGEAMPPWKLVYHRYKARSGYDTRAGLLRVCAWMYLFKNYDIKDWVAFAEIYGMPLRIGKYDVGASKNDKDALVAAIRSLGADAAGVISKNTEIEFVETAKQSGKDSLFEVLAKFCNTEQSKAILGQTATTEGTPGKLGNEDAQDKVRHDLIKADAEALNKTVRFQIIRPLVGYNFGWDKNLPWFKLLYEPAEDLKSLSEVYKNLHSINFPLTVKHVAEKFKVPLPDDGDDLLPAAAPSIPPALANSLLSLAIRAKNGDQGLARVIAALKNAGATGADFEGTEDDLIEILASGDAKITGRPDMAIELKLEKERQKFIDRYIGALTGAEDAIRNDALDEVVSLMENMDSMSEQAFIDQVYAVLEKSYGNLDKARILKPLKNCYSFYRLTDKSTWTSGKAPIKFSWGPRDDRTISFLEKTDRFYLSKYVANDDMKGSVWNFLKDQYLEKGSNLFGEGNMETINGFRDQFSDKLAQLSDNEIQRICDTSVARMRNYANIEKLREAKVQYATVVAVLDSRTSVICQAMNGKRILVAALAETVDKETAMKPEAYAEHLKARVTEMSAEAGNSLPPYHPNCRTRLVMDVK